MSGSGRRTNYRKGVTKNVLYGTPEPQENEHIVRVLALRGSNLFEVQDAQGETSLTMLPTKFRKLIWVKRGDFLIVHFAASEGAETTNAKGKAAAVTSIVEHILYKDQIQHLKNKNLWPEQFEAVVAKTETTEATEQTEDEQTTPTDASPSDAEEDKTAEDSAAPPAPVAAAASKNSFQMTNFDQYLNVNRNRRKGEFDDEEEDEESDED